MTLSNEKPASFHGNARRPSRLTRRTLKHLGQAAAYSSALFALDTVVLLSLGWLAKTTLTLVLFLQGGLGLLVGVGIALSSTPTISSLGQALLGTSPWSRGSEKHAETVGLKWIVTSTVLILIGFGVSGV